MNKYISIILNRLHNNKENIKKEKETLEFYSQFINQGDLCFDVGAHKGNRTKIFLKLDAKVIAIEPQKSCIDYLQHKFGSKSQLVLINKGLSDKEGKLTLHICGNATTISTFSNKWKKGRFSSYKWKKSNLVSISTMDNIIREYGVPKFCKIDVEGFEFQVFKGLSHPIPYISFEFTREFIGDAKLCTDYLLALGYKKFNCSLGESMKMIFKNWINIKDLYEKLDLIDDKLLWGDIYAKFT